MAEASVLDSFSQSLAGTQGGLEKATRSALTGLEESTKRAETAVGEMNKGEEAVATEAKREQQATKEFAIEHPYPHPDVKPWTEKPPQPQPLQDFGSWASAFGILAGALTKTPLASSLNASAAAMRAIQAGRWDQYDEAKSAWKENTEIALKQADWEARGYDAAFNLMKTDFAGGMAMAQTVAAKGKNDLMLETLRSGNIDKAHQIYQGYANFTAQGPLRILQMEELATKVEDTRDRAKLYEDWEAKHADAPPEEKARMKTAIMIPTTAAMMAAQNKWEVLHDQKTGMDFRYNPITNEATTLDGAPYTPQSAQRIQGGSARSGVAIALNKYLEENPNATSEDVKKFNAEFAAQRKALGDFSPGGMAGRQVNALNTATQHLDTLRELAKALDNGDVRTFNKISQSWSEEFGGTAPTNFDTAKQLIGAEIVKTFAQTGGGVTDRAEMQSAFDRASTPAQLDQAIDTAYKLMGGRMRSLQRDYVTQTKETDFGERLAPEAKKAMGFKEKLEEYEDGSKQGSKANPIPVKTDEDYNAVPSGAYIVTPDGQVKGPKP